MMNATLELDNSATPGSAYGNLTVLTTLALVNGTSVPATTARLGKHVVTDFLEKYYSVFILALGTIGNLLAFAVLSRKTFRVSTIGIFLRFLTLADLGALYTGVVYFLVKSLFDYDVRKTDELSCKFHRWLSYVTCDLSSWALVLVSTARLISIVWPMKRLVTRRRVYVAIVTTVVIIFGANIPMFVLYGNVYVPETKTWKLCVFTSKSYEEFYNHIWGWIVFLKFTAVPGLILTGLNTALVLSVSRTGKALVKMDEFGGAKPVKAAANAKLVFSRWRRQGRADKDDRSSTRESPDHADTEVYETDRSESGFDVDVDHETACAYCGRATDDKTTCLCLVIKNVEDPDTPRKPSVVGGWGNNNETPLADINELLKSHSLNSSTNTLLQTQISSPDKDNSAERNENIQTAITRPYVVITPSNSRCVAEQSVEAEPDNKSLSPVSGDTPFLTSETVSSRTDGKTVEYSQNGGNGSTDTLCFESVKEKDSTSNSSHTTNELFRGDDTSSSPTAITNLVQRSEVSTSATNYENTAQQNVVGNGDIAHQSVHGNGGISHQSVHGNGDIAHQSVHGNGDIAHQSVHRNGDIAKQSVHGNGDIAHQSVHGNGDVAKESVVGNVDTTKHTVSANTSTGSTSTQTTLLDEKDVATDAVSLASTSSGDSAVQSDRKASSAGVAMSTPGKRKKSGLRKSNNAPRATSSSSKSKSLTRSLLLINTVFLVTTIPISIYMSLKPYLFPGTVYSVEQEVYSTFSNFAMYTNNAINFILYCVTGSRFRQQLQLMFVDFYHACRRVFRKLT